MIPPPSLQRRKAYSVWGYVQWVAHRNDGKPEVVQFLLARRLKLMPYALNLGWSSATSMGLTIIRTRYAHRIWYGLVPQVDLLIVPASELTALPVLWLKDLHSLHAWLALAAPLNPRTTLFTLPEVLAQYPLTPVV